MRVFRHQGPRAAAGAEPLCDHPGWARSRSENTVYTRCGTGNRGYFVTIGNRSALSPLSLYALCVRVCARVCVRVCVCVCVCVLGGVKGSYFCFLLSLAPFPFVLFFVFLVGLSLAPFPALFFASAVADYTPPFGVSLRLPTSGSRPTRDGQAGHARLRD